MRTGEIILLALPLLLVVAWFLGLRHAGVRSFAVVAMLLAALAGALWWFGEQRAFTGQYRPARLQNGQIVR